MGRHMEHRAVVEHMDHRIGVVVRHSHHVHVVGRGMEGVRNGRHDQHSNREVVIGDGSRRDED